MPTLSVLIMEDHSFNFLGFIVGNGFHDLWINVDSLPYFEYYHGLIGKRLVT